MKKLLVLILSLTMALFLAACGNTEGTSSAGQKSAAEKNVTSDKKTDLKEKNTDIKTSRKILVAYFSRTGDNYEVGHVEKGNTHMMADMIAEATGADTFEIKTVKPYPADYRECTEVAKQELAENARPTLTGKVENWQDYDTVFLGYPIWWSELPMAVYTFMESYEWQGKTVIPFCTSAGDVLTGKEDNIPKYAKGAGLREGLGIRGKRTQENPESVRSEVMEWLKGLGYAGK